MIIDIKEKMYQKLLKDVSIRNKENNGIYSNHEIEELANQILKIADWKDKKAPIPIVQIIGNLGIKVYQSSLGKGIHGKIHVNGTTNKIYPANAVIFVNSEYELYTKRFILAYELAHFLFGYLGSKYEENKNLLFSYSYESSSIKERHKSKFAREILLPQEMFLKQYIVSAEKYPNRIFIESYLSRFFEVKENIVAQRIYEVIR